MMMGAGTEIGFVRRWLLAGGVVAVLTMALVSPAQALVKIFDGFGDADRNNDGAVAFYDTDLNISDTWNDPTADAALSGRNIVEVTAAQDPTDVGIVWSGIRSFDTAANIAKANVKIINDSVPTGAETAANIFNDGLALGVESRGGGSSFIGRFNQSVDLGPVAGDKLVISVDFRSWLEASNAFTPPDFNELRWGVFEDTDNELGASANVGLGGASVVWGRDDGNWRASQPGAEGDKGIYSRLTFGSLASPVDSRINWEYNQAGINGTANPAQIFEGTGVTDVAGTGGDVATLASPPGNGTGAIISNSAITGPHTMSIEIIRLADGLIEVASFVDNVEGLRDTIKTTDTGFSVLSPPPVSYDYVGFRNTADFDFVIDNFKVEAFGSNAVGTNGDYNNDGKVDAADYTVWRDRLGSPNALPNDQTPGVTAGDYDVWKANFGLPGSGSLSGAAVPEPGSVTLLLVCGLLAATARPGTMHSRARSA